MIKELGQYTIMFFTLVLIQVLILNNIQLSGYINPFLYVLFILLLPFQTPGYLLLGLAFVLGLVIDIFSNTIGLHTSATVFLAFLRPPVLNLISNRDIQEKGRAPRIEGFGLAWFTRYLIFLVPAHHLFLFFMEVFTFSGFVFTLGRAFISSVFSIFLILASQYILFKK